MPGPRAELFSLVRDWLDDEGFTPRRISELDNWCNRQGIPADGPAPLSPPVSVPAPPDHRPSTAGAPPGHRQTGANGIKLIQSFEQCRRDAYMPTPNDRPTIGWGSTGADIKLGMVWTQAQCDERFKADLGKFEKAVSEAIGSAPTTQNQFDAMVSLAYNIGGAGFAGSTVARKHKGGDHAGAANAFLMWNKQKGAVLRGLTRRREAERLLYLDPSA